MGTIKTTNIETITGSGTLTIGQSGETITIPSGVTITNNGTQTGFGGTNTPNFLVVPSSNQTISNDTTTLIAFQTVVFDTASGFNNTASNYKYTIPSTGKYQISYSARKNNFTNDTRFNLTLYKNGSEIDSAENSEGGAYDIVNKTGIYEFSSGDYLQVKIYQTTGGNVTLFTRTNFFETSFSGFKLIG